MLVENKELTMNKRGLPRPSKPSAKASPTIPITVKMLQGWALDLSQGDMQPRWEIETILRENGYSSRNPKT